MGQVVEKQSIRTIADAEQIAGERRALRGVFSYTLHVFLAWQANLGLVARVSAQTVRWLRSP